MNFLAALRLPPGAAIAVYAGEIPPPLRLTAAIARTDPCVIGVTYYGEPLMLFSCSRDAIDGIETRIQTALDEAVSRRSRVHDDPARTLTLVTDARTRPRVEPSGDAFRVSQEERG